MLDQTSSDLTTHQSNLNEAVSQIEQIIVGKPQQIRLAVCCLVANGHCLIEDLPGVGKTTLAHTIARVFGLGFNRIQFTSDLLPADILGVSIFDAQTQSFNFHPGPIFAHCILADELNRATPKTQSALLEAMEEHQITVEGQTRQLKDPFFVIGTQNPLDQSGTFPLPESQLDRFMMRLNLGYPDVKAERELLAGQDRQQKLQQLAPVLSHNSLQTIQQQVEQIHVSDPLLDYVQLLLKATRDGRYFLYGLSPRAALSLIKAARSWALMHGRDFVEPSDIQSIFKAVSSHRLIASEQHSHDVDNLLQKILESVPIP